MAYKNEYTYVQEALTLLKAISEREAKRHEMDQHLTPSMLALLDDEIIPMIENELDVDYAPDEVGEPPITMAEMHAAAWKEHQAMHSWTKIFLTSFQLLDAQESDGLAD